MLYGSVWYAACCGLFRSHAFVINRLMKQCLYIFPFFHSVHLFFLFDCVILLIVFFRASFPNLKFMFRSNANEAVKQRSSVCLSVCPAITAHVRYTNDLPRAASYATFSVMQIHLYINIQRVNSHCPFQ